MFSTKQLAHTSLSGEHDLASHLGCFATCSHWDVHFIRDLGHYVWLEYSKNKYQRAY